MRMGRQHLAPAAAAVALAGVLAGCGSGGGEQAPAPVVAVQVATASLGPLQQWVAAQAVLYPLRQAVLTPKIAAPVARFLVKRGDPVRAGELVAELENKDLK